MNSPISIWRAHKQLHNYLGREGRLLVWTKIFAAPVGFEHQAPYVVGIVELANKEKLAVQIVDCEAEGLKPNQKVTVVIRKIGKVKPDEVIEYGIKVKPI